MGWTTEIRREKGTIETFIHLSVKLLHSPMKKREGYIICPIQHVPFMPLILQEVLFELRELWEWCPMENVVIYDLC